MKLIFLLILTIVILYMANFKKIKSNINNTPMSESLLQGEFEPFHIGEINTISNKQEELNNKSNRAKNTIKPGRISQDTLEEYLEKTNNTKTNSTNKTIEVVGEISNNTQNMINVIKIPSHNPNYKNNY